MTLTLVWHPIGVRARLRAFVHPRVVKVSNHSRLYLELLTYFYTALEARSRLFTIIALGGLLADLVKIIAGDDEA